VYELVNGFIDHLHTALETTSNISVSANLNTSQITTAPAKPFSSLLSSSAVPWQRLLRVEILQLPALRSCFVTAARAELLLSTQLQRHFFSAHMQSSTANGPLTNFQAGGHFTPAS
jgi:hypothetical protein